MRAFLAVILALLVGGAVAAAAFEVVHVKNAKHHGSVGRFTAADYRKELNDICRRTKQDLEQVAPPTTVGGIPDYFSELVQTAKTDEEQVLQFPVPAEVGSDAARFKGYIREHKRLLSESASRAGRARTVSQLRQLLVSFVKRNARIKAGSRKVARKLGLSPACGG